MKDQVKRLRIFILIVCGLGGVAALHRTWNSICAVHYVTYSFDSQLSPSAQETISQFVRFFEYQGEYNPTAIVAQLPQEFPCIKSISVRHLPYHVAQVAVAAHDPVIRINDDCVLTEKQTIISNSYYALFVINELPELSVAAPVPSTVSEQIMLAIKRCMKESVFEQYALSFVGEHEWYLCDKNDPSFTLVCDTETFPIQDRIATYQRVKKKIKNRVNAKKWMADVRFDNQIILSMGKGGRHGKWV